jgi:hypothetical protein
MKKQLPHIPNEISQNALHPKPNGELDAPISTTRLRNFEASIQFTPEVKKRNKKKKKKRLHISKQEDE